MLIFSNNCIAGNKCISQADGFCTLCLNQTVLKNVLVGLHVTKGDNLEKDKEVTNRSFRYASYKQFTWWIYQSLGKGNRRVIPSCVLNKIRKTFPEKDGVYVMFDEGKKD